MEFSYSKRTLEYLDRLTAFMTERVYPSEVTFFTEVQANRDIGLTWKPTRIMEALKTEARKRGLWNLFMPDAKHGAALSNLEYAPLAEVMGRSPLAAEACNCSAPDTGNMEVLHRYGTAQQQETWLKPLLAGEIRSCFAMTEPDVASSDATNIQSRIERDGDHYILNGRKWWCSGAPDERTQIIIFMGKTAPDEPDRYRQQSMILVPKKIPGITVNRHLPVFGYDHAPHGHGEVVFENVRVPIENILLGEGRGFEIAQGRLGPGRIHHCMRLIGMAERALHLMCRRAESRKTFGQFLSDQTVTQERIAESRILIEQARLLTLKAAWMMDTVGNKAARREIAMIKVAAPSMACKVIDWAIQIHGAGGVCEDFPLAHSYALSRALRLADGPDEVHRNQIARSELRVQSAGST